MSELSQMNLDAIRRKPPHEALHDLNHIETTIRQSVQARDSVQKVDQLRLPVPVVEWLVDQIVFQRAAWEWIQVYKLPDEDVLWLLEMLALPECMRRARRRWQRTWLVEEALVQSNLHWRDVLSCRQRTSPIRRVPRTGAFQFYPRQLGPYQSPFRSPKRWPNPWKIPFDFLLTIKGPGAEGGHLLQPLLHGSSLTFTIELRTLTGSLFLDFPRDYNGAECIQQLHQLRSFIEQCVMREQTDGAVHSAEQEHQEYVGFLGRVRLGPAPDMAGLRQQWREYPAEIERDIERLHKPKLRKAQRAAILQRHFMIPATISLKPIHLLPLDLPTNALLIVIAAWMMERDLLSLHERRTVRHYVATRLLQLNSEMSPEQAQQLIPEVIQRLGNFARPLRGASVGAYLARVERRKAPGIQEDLGDYSPEVEEVESEHEEDSVLMESVKQKGTTRSRLLPATRRVPRGSLQRVAQRLGCHPKTVTRRYQRYCRTRKLTLGLEAWHIFQKHLSRQKKQNKTPRGHL